MRIWGKRESKMKLETPVMSADKMLEAFAVDPETPLLKGVLATLAGLEEMAKEQVMICELKDAERAFYAGGISKLAEAQGTILDLVKKGNEQKLTNRR